MKFKFIGKYTGTNESINVGGPAEKGGVMFVGRDPVEVEDEELVRRLSNNPDFAKVHSGGRPAKEKPHKGKAKIDESDLENEADAGWSE